MSEPGRAWKSVGADPSPREERDSDSDAGLPRSDESPPEGASPEDELPADGPSAFDPVADDPAFDPDEETDVRAVLLDMGGVVLDLGEARGLPWGELDRRGRQALLERIRETGGTAAEDDLERWLFEPWQRGYARRNRTGREERWGPHLARLRRLSGSRATRGSLLGAWAGPYLRGIRAVSGAQEALGHLAAADLRLGLVSNVPMPGAFYERVLDREGVAAFFDTRCFSYDLGARKPGPLLLLRALERLGVEPDEAVMVGDRRSTDVAAGRAAGLRTVWVTGGDADGPEADATLGSLVELPALLGL